MKTSSADRLGFLDWTRGLAAVIMLQGHAYHSLLRQDLRNTSLYILSDFLGGMPSAIFLFLTGVTLAFLMDSRARQGAAAGERVRASLRRAGYILTIAVLVRLQLWLFAWPGSDWSDVLRVDVLNVMGVSLALLSPLAVLSTVRRVRYGAVAGLVIAGLSPLVSRLDWSGVPPLARSYLAPDYFSFGLFPWAAFVAFGLSAGSALRLLDHEKMDRPMQWAALCGCALLIASQYASTIPYSLYGASEFWLNSPFMILGKLGAILLILAFAYLWTKHARRRWSWVRQLGTTSLLVYWVHIELIYGRWLGQWHANLDSSQTTLAAVALIAAMVALSAARQHHRKLGGWLSALRLPPVPARVPGD